MSLILVKKSLEGVPFQKNGEKILKSAVFEVESPLKIGPDLRKFWKK